MKRKLLLLNIVISSIFLSGCWWKKKTENNNIDIAKENNYSEKYNINSDTESFIDSNEINEANIEEFDLKNSDENKSIFDEENDNNLDLSYSKNNNNESKDNLDSFYKDESKDEYLNIIESEKNHANKIMIGTLLFEFDKYDYKNILNKNEFDYIDNKIKEYLSKNKDIKILVKGHSCSSAGSYDYNMQLSCRRAEAVSKKLSKLSNIPLKNIEFVGVGTNELLTKGNRSEQSKNRRAEIFILN